MKRQVIASRNVRVLLVGQTVNMFGNTAMTIVLGIWVKNLTGSSGAAGLIFMLIAATAFLAPVTGTLVDRFPRRPLLIVNDTLTGAVMALLLLVHDRNELWLIYVVTGAYGISGRDLPGRPGRPAALPGLRRAARRRQRADQQPGAGLEGRRAAGRRGGVRGVGRSRRGPR